VLDLIRSECGGRVELSALSRAQSLQSSVEGLIRYSWPLNCFRVLRMMMMMVADDFKTWFEEIVLRLAGYGNFD
jgi:hypothetical protein